MGKLINRIPGSRLLISSLPGSRYQQAFSKPCLVNLISKDTHLVFSIYDDTKTRTHDSQIVRAIKNLKFSYGGPSQRQASGTNKWIKALCQGRH